MLKLPYIAYSAEIGEHYINKMYYDNKHKSNNKHTKNNNENRTSTSTTTLRWLDIDAENLRVNDFTNWKVLRNGVVCEGHIVCGGPRLVSVDYSLSNVIMVDNKFVLFHQYLRYCNIVVPLYSVYQALTYEPNFTNLAWIWPRLAHLSMLFILELTCTEGSAHQLKNK